MKLRDYQSNASNSVFKEWEDVDSTLVVLPTGTGKTVLFADIIQKMQPKRAVVIAHREELIWQARDKISRFTGLDCGIEMGELSVSQSLFGDTPVVISTVQTQNSDRNDHKRMGRFKPEDFGLLVIDEAHHGTAESYKNLINYYRQNKSLKVLGVTATPDRADEEALGQIFQTVAFDYEILDAINDGWLVPVQQQFVHINGLDFSHIRTTAGDLNGADLNAVMESESNMHGVAGATLDIVGERRTIVFTASVRQAEVISNIFNRHRTGMSEWVCGATNKDVRREILGRFEKGLVQVVCNCGVLTEGFDNPGVEVVVMARPTKSRALYAQMAGRSTRPLPDTVDHLDTAELRRQAIAASWKPCCRIIDFVGNSGKHKLMSSLDILGGNVSDAAIQRAIVKAKKSNAPVNVTEELLKEEEELRKEMEQRRRDEEARKSRLMAKVKHTSQFIDPFDAYEITPVRERGWDAGKVLSEKQKNLLLKMGMDPDSMPYAQGRQLLNEQFRRWNKHLCTVKQAALLKRFGVETHDLPMKKASKLIDCLAANRWRIPNNWAALQQAL